MYRISYADEVVKDDLPNILEPWKTEIRKAIETKLTTRPEIYSRPLRRSLKGYRKLRVGGYRIILRIENNNVKIFIIQHRSTVYTTAPHRL
ncbi:MAG TPA: type II toxin-antitoxin system RelE/ParE family toxin [Candidatus Saccharimonadales bacterium]|nr:type II toxin-antitoxin system RelE/ParE family toxin [Candidatus Saccharimonadales bacterium]